MNTDTIQMSLFDYFMEDEQFTIPEATALVKEQKNLQEKMRVLKEGAFCGEFLPEENEVNYQYLYEIKQMAIKEGFKYFTKVPWIKGDFKANTGRKSKNREDIMFFSKGEPRTLKLDAKKNIQLAKENDID